MKIAYNILIVLAGVGFAIGVILKMFMGGVAPYAWMAPETLWRGAIGGIGFTLVFLLMEIRDLMKAKK